MVEPADVPRVLSDAGRLLREGELVVFGSAALVGCGEHVNDRHDDTALQNYAWAW